MGFPFDDREKQFVRTLAKLTKKNDWGRITSPRDVLKQEGLDLDYQEFCFLMRLMEEHGAIRNAVHALAKEGRFVTFEITLVAVQLEREIDRQEQEANEPRDIVEQVKGKAKSNPIIAWIIIVGIILTTAIALANQTWQLVERIWPPAPAPQVTPNVPPMPPAS